MPRIFTGKNRVNKNTLQERDKALNETTKVISELNFKRIELSGINDKVNDLRQEDDVLTKILSTKKDELSEVMIAINSSNREITSNLSSSQ